MITTNAKYIVQLASKSNAISAYDKSTSYFLRPLIHRACIQRQQRNASTFTIGRFFRRETNICLITFPLYEYSASCSASTKSTSRNSASDLEEMSTEAKNAQSIYDFTVKDTYGNNVSLETYKGNVVLIVNIASQCGLTKDNYKKLTVLKEKYSDKDLKILNFPCNQFASEMPEADGEAMICHLRDANADIGDVFQKIDVNGSDAAPLYQYLKTKQGGALDNDVEWNFAKFLVDRKGVPVNRYAPTTDPMDIANDIDKLL